MLSSKVHVHINSSVSVILICSLLGGLAFFGGSATGAQAKTGQVVPNPGQSQLTGFRTPPIPGYPGNMEPERKLAYRAPTNLQSSTYLPDAVNLPGLEQAVSEDKPEDLMLGYGQIQGLKPAAYSGNMPASVDPNSLPADKITIDLTYDIVAGWVEPGQVVSVTYGSEGYGTAEADSAGFFWTPIWHNTD